MADRHSSRLEVTLACHRPQGGTWAQSAHPPNAIHALKKHWPKLTTLRTNTPQPLQDPGLAQLNKFKSPPTIYPPSTSRQDHSRFEPPPLTPPPCLLVVTQRSDPRATARPSRPLRNQFRALRDGCNHHTYMTWPIGRDQRSQSTWCVSVQSYPVQRNDIK